MHQGKIIEYIDHGKFVCTFCLLDKGSSLHLLTSSNREVKLSPKRAVIISESATNTSKPRENLLERLRRTEKRRISLKDQINVKELWELIRDEKESFDHKYLSQLVFGKKVTDDHLSALVRALFEDRLHFKMKDGRFLPNSEEKVDKILRQKEEESLKEERLNYGSAWLKDIQQGKKPEDPPHKEDIISLLIQLALYGTDAPDAKYGKELLSRAGISEIQKSKELLINLGIWEEDENLDLLRLGIETSFTEEQLDESARLAESEIGFKGREDLRDLPTLTIDGPLTRDYDDAVSLEIVDDVLHLGIHIADVAAVISPDSTLDHQAAERAMSLYLPRRQIPMIPPSLSQDTLSLKQGYDRQAISLLARFDKIGKLLDYRFVPSVIRVRQKLTYDEINETLNPKDQTVTPSQSEAEKWADLLQEMYQISQRLKQKRMNQDALSLSLPDIRVKLNPDSTLSLEMDDQNTPSRMIIAELMILYNCLAARFCRDNQVPVLYRTQSEPSERLSEDEAGYVYYVFKQRRKLSPAHIDTVPSHHSGLGLDAYLHATSPIRRYLDLVAQRQIGNFLIGIAPAYDEKQLEEARIFVEPVIRDLQNVKRNRIRYWTLKFLNQQRGKKYKALILDELKRKYRIVLSDFYLVAEIERRNGIILKPGEEILVEVKKADPWENLLKLAYAE